MKERNYKVVGTKPWHKTKNRTDLSYKSNPSGFSFYIDACFESLLQVPTRSAGTSSTSSESANRFMLYIQLVLFLLESPNLVSTTFSWTEFFMIKNEIEEPYSSIGC